VLEKPSGLNVSKANVYIVLTPNNSNPPIWPSFTFSNGVVGLSYSQSFDLTPAAQPTTYTLASGSLPPGLALSNVGADVGEISGTPTAVGTYSFALTAANSFGSALSNTFTITIASPSSAVVVPVAVNLAGGTTGVAYSETITVQGGTSPYTFAVTSGALPTSTTLNSSSGVISGTPTVAGTFTFTITVTDSLGFTGSQAFSVIISAPAGGAFTFG
jgi:hypothetical protein